MKTILTCDDVFDALTRGPFPAGNPGDAAVERHLACCHDCRQMAEALRPAVALFHESLVEEEPTLPAYRGKLTAAQTTRESILAAMLAETPPPAGRTLFGLSPQATANLVRVFSAGLLAASLCLVAWSAAELMGPLRTGRMSGQPSVPMASAELYRPSGLMLTSVSLPRVCRGAVAPLTATATMGADIVAEAGDISAACCTRCHAAAHPQRDACRGEWHARCVACHVAGPPLRLATREIAIAREACRGCHDG
jgi:predicted anti-sigma-YlaC factor YlaD